jgi:hypothetical protein
VLDNQTPFTEIINDGDSLAPKTSGRANWPVSALVSLPQASAIVTGLSTGSKITVFGIYRFNLLQTSTFNEVGNPTGVATLTSVEGEPVFYNETPYTVLCNYNGASVSVPPAGSTKSDWPAVLEIAGVVPAFQARLSGDMQFSFPADVDNAFGIDEFVISQTQTSIVLGALHNNEVTVTVTSAATNAHTVNFSSCTSVSSVVFDPKVVKPGSTLRYSFNPEILRGDVNLSFSAYDVVTTKPTFLSPLISYLKSGTWSCKPGSNPTCLQTATIVVSSNASSSASITISF